jgi:hypothetical protein
MAGGFCTNPVAGRGISYSDFQCLSPNGAGSAEAAGVESAFSDGAGRALGSVATGGEIAVGEAADGDGAAAGSATGPVWPRDLLADFGLAGLGAGGFFDVLALVDAGDERGSRRSSAKAPTPDI